MAIILLALGLAGGFFSGWLGIGGGIIMAPLLLYVPSWLGAGALDMKTVAGLTMVQSLFATGSGVIVHHRFRFVSKPLVAWMGGCIAVTSFAGALLSRNVSADLLLGIFAALAAIAAASMFIPLKEGPRDAAADEIDFNRGLAAGFALALGFTGGLVGQSGAFIIIPFLLYVLRLPLRVALGSSLGIVLLAAMTGTAGKIMAGQVDYSMALFCVAGALAGAQAGGYLSRRTAKGMLRLVLALLILASALRMVADLVMHTGD
ncbi:MAG: sulfite exporter TauE/SafE family protein [Gaiellales bacterium]|nr:MAG: sulfite exporter TauE/SafE family protein [Gaiellales bacterium]